MTIISNSHRFVFVHLHKCGGSSVETAYQPHASWNDLVIGSTPEGEQLQPIYRKLHGLQKHSPASELRRVLGPVWDAYWTFAMVRHPARIYESFYKWSHRILLQYSAKTGISVEDVKSGIRSGGITRPFVHNVGMKPYVNAADFNDFALRMLEKNPLGTMTQRLGDAGGMLPDDIYRLEESGPLWSALSDRTGIDIQPLHVNAGHDTGGLQWSDAARQALLERHHDDFETFGYPER